MMESNSEMKIENNMEPKLTYTRKEKFNDSFFIRKPIVGLATDPDSYREVADANSEQIKNCNEQASFAFSYTQPHSMKTTSTQVLNSEQPLTVNHTKTSFMKRFLRNAFPLAIAFVIANLFFIKNSFSQSQTIT